MIVMVVLLSLGVLACLGLTTHYIKKFMNLKNKMKLLTTQVIDLDLNCMESVQSKEFAKSRRSQDRKKRLKKQEKKECERDGQKTADVTTKVETAASKIVDTDKKPINNLNLIFMMNFF